MPQVVPDGLNTVALKATAKRPRKNMTDDDALYTPAPKRKKKAVCAAPVAEALPKGKILQKGKKKAARLADMDTPVIKATQDDKTMSGGGECKRRETKKQGGSDVAGIV